MTRRHSSPRSVKFLGVGDRQVRVIASDGTVDRMGDILVPWGVDLTNYKRNPVVLAQHDSSQPIARCASIGVDGDAVVALIDFPAAGVSARSDEYLRLMKAGVLGAVSVGFLPIKQEPIRDGGWKFTEWELLELSVVSVPANPAALVTQKSLARNKDQMARDLTRAASIRRRDAASSTPGQLADDAIDYSAEIASARTLHARFMQGRAARVDQFLAALLSW